MAGNLKELREEYPELVAELEQTVLAQAGQEKSAAAEAERCRLQEIDKVAALFDAELVRAAKYGEQACTAQELAYRAAQAAAEKRQSFLGDIMQSGAAQVGALPNNEPTMAENLSPEQRMAQARAEVKALLGKEKQ